MVYVVIYVGLHRGWIEYRMTQITTRVSSRRTVLVCCLHQVQSLPSTVSTTCYCPPSRDGYDAATRSLATGTRPPWPTSSSVRDCALTWWSSTSCSLPVSISMCAGALTLSTAYWGRSLFMKQIYHHNIYRCFDRVIYCWLYLSCISLY